MVTNKYQIHCNRESPFEGKIDSRKLSEGELFEKNFIITDKGRKFLKENQISEESILGYKGSSEQFLNENGLVEGVHYKFRLKEVEFEKLNADSLENIIYN